MVLLELIAFRKIAALKLLPRLVVLRHHPDPVARLGIDHVEADRGTVVARVVKRDRTRNEREPQLPAPDGSLCHAKRMRTIRRTKKGCAEARTHFPVIQLRVASWNRLLAFRSPRKSNLAPDPALARLRSPAARLRHGGDARRRDKPGPACHRSYRTAAARGHPRTSGCRLSPRAAAPGRAPRPCSTPSSAGSCGRSCSESSRKVRD